MSLPSNPVNIVIATENRGEHFVMTETLLKSLCCYHNNINMMIFVVSSEELNVQFRQDLKNKIFSHQQNKILDVQFIVCESHHQTTPDAALQYTLETLLSSGLGRGSYWLYMNNQLFVTRPMLQIFETFELAEFQDAALMAVRDIQSSQEKPFFHHDVLYIHADRYLSQIPQSIESQNILKHFFGLPWLELSEDYYIQIPQQIHDQTANYRARMVQFAAHFKPEDCPNLERYRYYHGLEWKKVLSPKTVAVITSTIGRAELERAILSVQKQTYPCKHYIFVDGSDYHDAVRPLQEKYPEIIFTYLPMNTGSGGWTNSYINAIAPFLVQEDIICYLDDDNWYDEHHVENIIQGFDSYENLDIVYTLRRFMNEQSEYVCDDDQESLGFFYVDLVSHYLEFNGISAILQARLNRNMMVDTNCLAMTRETAREFAHYWTQSKENDSFIWKKAIDAQKRILNTGKRTVNYIFPIKAFDIPQQIYELFKVNNEQKQEFVYKAVQAMNQDILKQNEAKWQKPAVYVDNMVLMF